MQTKSRTSLVLMELIITVFFFSICSAVCVQLFVNSHSISNRANELNKAVSKAGSFAEVMRGTDGSIDEITKIFSNAVKTGSDSFEVYYDGDFNEISNKADSVYYAEVSLKPDGNIMHIDINIIKNDSSDSESTENSDDDEEENEIIYSLKASKLL